MEQSMDQIINERELKKQGKQSMGSGIFNNNDFGPASPRNAHEHLGNVYSFMINHECS